MARPRIVIAGAGYAGLVTALLLDRLAGDRVVITLVDRRAEHHLITRLHLIAAERIAPAGGAVPLAELMAHTTIRFRQATVEAVDLARGRVETDAGPLFYDRLVVALGGEPDDHGIPGVRQRTLSLRGLEDARRVHAHLRAAVYHATRHSGDRTHPRTVLIVGGGPTGVELTAELAAWLPDVASAYGLGRKQIRLHLVEAAPRLLPTRDLWLAQQAAAALERRGVRLVTGAVVAGVDATDVALADGRRLPAALVIWTAGIRAPRHLADAGFQVGVDGRAHIDSHLAALGHPEVLVVGDSALTRDPANGVPYEPSAQLAVQQAKAAASNLAAELANEPARPFRLALPAEVLSLGPGRAVASVGGMHVSGPPAIALDVLAERRYLLLLGGPRLVVRQVERERNWRWRAHPTDENTT